LFSHRNRDLQSIRASSVRTRSSKHVRRALISGR
jgi:hypothetical protein